MSDVKLNIEQLEEDIKRVLNDWKAPFGFGEQILQQVKDFKEATL